MNQAKRHSHAHGFHRAWIFAILLLAIGFSTVAQPSVLHHSPARGEELAIDGTIEILFDQAMDRASVEAAWLIEPGIDGTFEWPTEQTLRFRPIDAWVRDATYHVTLATSAQSAKGEQLANPVEFELRTVGFLAITQVLPASDSQNVAVDSGIFLLFNRPVVPLTTLSDPALADLPDPLSIAPTVSGRGEWVNTSMYVFTPDEPLIGGTVYTATVHAGLTDTTGGLLPQDVVWQFSTQRPEVVWISPSSNDDLVPIDASIRITFNMPVALASVEDRLVLRTAGLLGELFAVRVAGTLSVDGNDVVFTPREKLAFDQSYVLSLDAGVTGANGGLGADDALVSRFRTVPLPRILETDPESGESDVYPYTSFLIRFNAPVDPDSVLENITVLPTPEPGELSGYFRSWDNAYVLRFGAGPSQDYEVRIGPNIVDPYGNRTNQPMTIRFRTRALDPTAWLHVPGQSGTFSTYEQASLFVGHRNTDALTLTLYRLTLDEYFEATDNWYDYTPRKASQIRKWTVAVNADLNEIGYDPVDLVPDGGLLDPGIYLINLEARGVDWNRWQHRHLLLASPTNLTIKTSEDQTLVWACDLLSGEPLPGLILRTYDSDGNKLDATVTDRDGVATFEGTQAYDWRGVTVASTSPFVLGNSQWTSGMSIWDFGFSSGGSVDERLFLDTDRPIYRPGQVVSFRGVLRDEQDVLYSLPDQAPVRITVRDPNWETVYEVTTSLDEIGTFADALQLTDDAAIGTYRIEVETASSYYSNTFDVAAYRAPEFQVVVTPEADEIVAGQTIRALVQVDYFFGAPVVGQSLDWDVYAEDYRFSPSQWGRYTFTDQDDPWSCWSCWWLPPTTPSSILTGSGQTDTSGQLLIELPADLFLHADEEESTPGSRSLILEATTRGADGQVISGRGTVIIHAADVYVGLATARSVARAGDPTNVEILTVDWTGERVPSQPLQYQIIRREWENVFEESEAGGGQWTWTVNDIKVEDGALTTDASGVGSFAFTPSEGGTYKVLVLATDEEGHETRSSLFVWASGPETVSWRRSNDDRITLIPDKTAYEVGETARILIPSPYAEPHWALVTVERSGILSRDVMLLESNSTVLELSITPSHIPNIYVSVVLFQGLEAAQTAGDEGSRVAETKVGYAALTVSRDPKALQLTLQPSETEPLPATQMTYDLWVTDDAGNPVRAALAFDLVDASVLALKPRTPHAILDAFYGLRGLGVSTSSGLTISINRLVAEQLAEFDDIEQDKMMDGAVLGAAFAPTAMAEEAGGMTASDVARSSAVEKLPEGVTLREDFQDTAFWDGSIITDGNGFAQVTFQLPDNLTTWVARAVGVTADTEVGEVTGELLVTKPLLVRPVTPRFFVVGDHVRLLANVSNQTDSDLSAQVTLAQTGLMLEQEAVQTLIIPANGEISVEWWGTVQDVSLVDVAFSAVSGDLSDAARPRLTTGPDGTLRVYRYTSPEIVGTAGQLDEAGSRTEIISLLPGADLDRSELLIRLETSLAAAMLEGLDYLEHFEYECTEQVISRFLPNVLTVRALQQLGIDNPLLEEKLPSLVTEGLAKLHERQNADGGWGWWDNEDSNVYTSAYAVFSLLQARQAGFEIRTRIIDDGLDYLGRSLGSIDVFSSASVANRQAWITYVLAEGGRDSAALRSAQDLFDARAKLSHYARAWLALSLEMSGATEGMIDTLVSDLYSQAIISSTGVHWEESTHDAWAMNTDTRSSAIILDALVRLDPDQPMLPNVVRWLMVARKGGIWETTQETAWALIALTDWMVATGESAPTYEFSTSLNGTGLFAGQTDGDPFAELIELPVSATQLNAGAANALTISRGDGSGRLYYTAHLTTYVPVVEIDALQRGIIVQRQYVSSSCPFGETCAELDSVSAGEEIQVRLSIIAPHDLYYVVIEDPFPAGCEAIDPTLATTSLASTEPGLFRDTDDSWHGWWSWWWRWYSRYEFRDEKVALFAETLPAGTYTFQYSLRAVVPGTYGVLPTLAQEFYFPEVFGRSDGRKLVIEPAD